MRWYAALVLALAIPAAACTNHTINFDHCRTEPQCNPGRRRPRFH